MKYAFLSLIIPFTIISILFMLGIVCNRLVPQCLKTIKRRRIANRLIARAIRGEFEPTTSN